ncbi:portal vertex protein [uncultured Caudovirales phage]|uniref:Portal protein n=1 Tax=uncultured Caudovirales phage TaxID=2100421 RepID=A0A6J5M337_9CAUD|nr:portal vertex protein [uncultured Caudovirales phage]
MAFNLFGWNLKKTKDEEKKDEARSFVLPENQDGAVNIAGVAGAYGAYIDFDGTIKNEFELVTRYRELSLLPDVDYAIDDIINEMIIMDGNSDAVKINLEKLRVAKPVKRKIEEEFKNVLTLLDWNNQAYEIARKWYIDGRLYYHVILDEAKKDRGILELRYIDPRQIRKIREIDKRIDQETGIELLKVKDEYFTYNSRGINFNAPNSYSSIATMGGVKIKPDSISYVHSGIVDKYSAAILSNLHKAIKPINQLKMMEDALVIYRIARAPERRIFYVDVGNLPKSKADEYLRTVMQRYRNKLQYNIETGEMKDGPRFQSMLEDYWLPRREGSQGTSIDTLPGGENLGELADVEYFQKKVYRALNVPLSRLESGTGFQLGKAAEISRDEIKFSKFIHRIRLRFSHLFDDLLKKQLILKRIINAEEWPFIREAIKYDFNTDNHFSEMKDMEVLKSRIEVLQMMENYSTKYFSVNWIRQNVLHQTNEEREIIDREINDEKLKYSTDSIQQDLTTTNTQKPTNTDLDTTDSDIDLDYTDSGISSTNTGIDNPFNGVFEVFDPESD